jgi:DNA ligase-1
VRAFTRSLADVTDRVPEVVAAVLELPVDAIVLDGEVIALRSDGTPHPFQVSMSRFGTGSEGAVADVQLPLASFFFDCLHLDGVDLLDRAYGDRVAALAGVVPSTLRVPRKPVADADEGERFLEDALARGHEGVVVKALDARYEAGRRGAAWVKVKRATTLDLVVLAAEWGHGRRQGWLSNVHLGARGDAGFVMVGKTFKGMTDELLRWQTTELQRIAIGTDRSAPGSSRAHVVHVAPELVVEVAIDGVQASRRYPGGVALRFARVRRYRPDKTPAEADAIESVRALLR